MAHFVRKQSVHVTHEKYPGEYIAIKAKLSLADRNKIQGAMAMLNDEKKVDVDLGKYFNTILEVALTGWELWERDENDGVLYEGEGEEKKPKRIKFDKKLIEDFDPDDELIDATLAKIAELNPTLAGNTTQGSSD